MSVRIDDRQLDTLLADWFDEGPNTAADFVVERALERVPNARRRGAGWWLRLPQLLRAQGPLLATVALLLVLGTALVVALAEINRPVIPTPSEPPIATSSPSAAPTPFVTPRPVVNRGTFEISTPYGSVPSRTWPDFRVVHDRPADGLPGYLIGEPLVADVTIYMDPEADYLGTWDTTRADLVVSIYYNNNGLQGNFLSTSGECRITFDEFLTTVVSGRLDCTDVPGTYANYYGQEGEEKEGVAQLSGTFTFDPSAGTPPGGPGNTR